MSAPRRIKRPFPVIAIGIGLIVGALAAGSAPTAAQGSPEDVLSHFLCYRGTFPTFAPVPNVVFARPVRSPDDDRREASPVLQPGPQDSAIGRGDEDRRHRPAPQGLPPADTVDDGHAQSPDLQPVREGPASDGRGRPDAGLPADAQGPARCAEGARPFHVLRRPEGPRHRPRRPTEGPVHLLQDARRQAQAALQPDVEA